jgi:GNAT superfamily N-acetyltransferase
VPDFAESCTFVPALDAAGVEAAARAAHPLWGGSQHPDAYVAHVGEQRARSDGALELAGLLDASGTLACSLKRYELTLALPGGPRWPAVGLGAIFTRPSSRRRGLAAGLVRRVLADAGAGGARLALLFSDIGCAYYERLGFAALPALSWRAARASLPSSGALGLEPTEDPDALAAVHAASAATLGALHVARSAASWRYWLWRHGARTWLLRDGGGAAAGFVAACVRDRELWIHDAAAIGPVAPEAVHAALGVLADALEVESVAGWLRPRVACPPFTPFERDGCIPMLAALDQTAAQALDGAASFSALDAF